MSKDKELKTALKGLHLIGGGHWAGPLDAAMASAMAAQMAVFWSGLDHRRRHRRVRTRAGG